MENKIVTVRVPEHIHAQLLEQLPQKRVGTEVSDLVDAIIQDFGQGFKKFSETLHKILLAKGRSTEIDGNPKRVRITPNLSPSSVELITKYSSRLFLSQSDLVNIILLAYLTD